ncbi:unnamed protein product [Urochloa humidicola]
MFLEFVRKVLDCRDAKKPRSRIFKSDCLSSSFPGPLCNNCWKNLRDKIKACCFSDGIEFISYMEQSKKWHSDMKIVSIHIGVLIYKVAAKEMSDTKWCIEQIHFIFCA